jgi:hypothetical protein
MGVLREIIEGFFRDMFVPPPIQINEKNAGVKVVLNMRETRCGRIPLLEKRTDGI